MRGTNSAALASALTTHDNALTTLSGDVATLQVTATALDSAMEVDGLGGYQFTTLGLENAPTGGGGDPWITDISSYTGVQAGKIVSDILADTAELQTNQGNWLTATGFATTAALTAHDNDLTTLTGNIATLQVTATALDSAMETDGVGGYQFTALGLENAPGGGGGVSVVFNPIVGQAECRRIVTTIRTFQGEDYTATVSAVDSENTIIDWTTLGDLRFVIESSVVADTDVVVIENASITKTTTYFQVTIPASVNDTAGEPAKALIWSIRKVSGDNVVLRGDLIVSYAAIKDV